MITNIYIVICAAIFFYINFITKEDKTAAAIRLGALYPPRIRRDHEYWRFLTANFIHIEFFHCAMNLYALYILGAFFEKLYSGVLYTGLLLAAMFFTSFVTYRASFHDSRHANTVTIGASGVFYGYLGAMTALGFFLQGNFLTLLQSNIYVIVINVAFTLLNPHISKTGHLGGFLGGFLYTYALYLLGVIR